MFFRKHAVSRSLIMITSKIVLCLLVATAGKVVAQNTEDNVKFVETEKANEIVNNTNQNSTTTNQPTKEKPSTTQPKKEIIETEPNFIIKLYNTIVKAIQDFFASPRVMTVFRNIGTCMVNGAMEIMTYYVPAPMIPLIASAAGMIIPFEPVVTLREKMPVTSYRRAFNKAVNSFMGTFDKYKDINVEVDDPYMTKKFNRRFLNDSPEKRKGRYDE